MALRYNSKTGEWEGTTGGVDVVELDRRTPKATYQIEKTQEQKQAETRSQIMQDDNYSYVIRLVNYISKEMGLKLAQTVFRNRAVSCFKFRAKQLIFSYQSIDRMITQGFIEYSTVGHVWTQNGYKGKYTNVVGGVRMNGNFWLFDNGQKALWMVVLHEMAHALQGEDKGYGAYSIHNDCFNQKLEELIILFPYNEVKNI